MNHEDLQDIENYYEENVTLFLYNYHVVNALRHLYTVKNDMTLLTESCYATTQKLKQHLRRVFCIW